MKNYVNKSLMPNEKVVKTAKFTKILFLPAILVFAFFFLLFLTGLKQGFGEAFPFLLVGAILGVILSVRGIVYHKFSEFAVTDKKVIGKVGIIKTNELSSPLKQIQNVQIKSGLFGKIFKYGTVDVTTTTGVYNFKYIEKPTEFRNIVMAQIEKTEEDKMDLNAQKIAQAISDNK